MNEVISNYSYVLGDTDDNAIVNEVLLKPASICDELHILSGYSNSSMLKRHIELLDDYLMNSGRHVKINLILGMVPKEGVPTIEHLAFKDIVSSFPNIMCSYLNCNCKPCHSKVYVWLNVGVPVKAFIGSANYSQNAFFNQIESLYPCDPVEAEAYYQQFVKWSIYCNHDEVEDAVKIVSKKKFMDNMKRVENNPEAGVPAVVLSLLDTRTHDVHKASGLNWGQRPGREPNQACIAIPRSVGKSGFFPPKKQVFTLMTDDGYVMQCVSQGNKESDPIPKQFTTTNNNSEIGRYFRRRLGVPEGAFVTKADLDRYGRTNVTVFKLDDGTYYMEYRKLTKHELRVDVDRAPTKLEEPQINSL